MSKVISFVSSSVPKDMDAGTEVVGVKDGDEIIPDHPGISRIIAALMKESEAQGLECHVTVKEIK